MRGLLLINCTEAHVPSVRYGQYLMHALNHITRAADNHGNGWVALIGACQLGIAVWSISGGQLAYQRPFTTQASASNALIVSSTVNKRQLSVGNCKTVLPRHAYGDGIRKIDLCAQINLKQYQLTALKHTYQLCGMASTLRMRTTMNPNKGETAVHGCQGRGDMVVRMRTVLAIPRSWYVCFGAVNWYCF